jgi:hypothetical protein
MAPSMKLVPLPDSMAEAMSAAWSCILRPLGDPRRHDLTYAGQAAIFSFAICVAILIGSVTCTGRWQPKSYDDPEPGGTKRRVVWHTTSPSLLPAVVVPLYTIPAVWGMIARCGLGRCEASQDLWFAYGFSCGYQLFDTVAMLLYPRTLAKHLTPELFWALMLHHTMAVLFWTVAMASGEGTLYVAYGLTRELTAPPLNVRWCAVETGADESLVFILNLVVFSAFTLVRFAPIPAMLWYLANVDKTQFNTWENALWVSAFVPICLNTHWYSGMVKTAIAALSGGVSSDEKVSKQD